MSRTSRTDPGLTHRLSRRGMLGVASGATAALLGAAATPATAATDAETSAAGRGRPVLPPGRLGIQLYGLRDKVSTLGFAAVFAELEKYGYDEVEFAGYSQGSAGPITLAQLKRLARNHGLNPIGSHVGYYSNDPNAYTFAQNLTKVLDDAQALGLKHIGTASPSPSPSPGGPASTCTHCARSADGRTRMRRPSPPRGGPPHTYAQDIAHVEGR